MQATETCTLTASQPKSSANAHDAEGAPSAFDAEWVGKNGLREMGDAAPWPPLPLPPFRVSPLIGESPPAIDINEIAQVKQGLGGGLGWMEPSVFSGGQFKHS